MDIFGLASNILTTGINNVAADYRTQKDRRQNYLYNEMAAQNADKRTRALYSDFYSPEALKRQYEEAGLSPSLMYGGTPGQGGMSGAQGAGSAGLQTPYMPLSMLEAAQISKTQAETKNIEAETNNINADTANKELQNAWQDMVNKEKSVDFALATTYLTSKEDGKTYSMYEIAENTNTYDDFLKKVREYGENSGNTQVLQMISTEQGQKTMRSIFLNANRFDHDIKVLSQEGVSAEFQKKIINCLDKEGFAEQQATTTIKELEAAAESADLTKEQKSAWNNILDRLRKKNSTAADIIIVCSMILNQAASHWVMPKMDFGDKNITVVKQ